METSSSEIFQNDYPGDHPAMNSDRWSEDYRTIRDRAGMVALPAWSRVELRGRDRIRLLNSLATNRLDDLLPGGGCETFLTEIKGRTIAHGFVLAGEQAACFITPAPQGEAIAAHFERYIIREDVQVADRSEESAFWYLGGGEAEALLENAGMPAPESYCGHAAGTLQGERGEVCRVEMAGPTGFLLTAPRRRASALARALEEAGAVSCALEAFEAARIQWGWPLDGIDISPENFPQEVGRDERAISFTKGCYLGQETVARIDSRGHVNKRLCIVRFPEAEAPGPATLSAEGKAIGQTTSTAFSPQFGCPIALAYVRREWSEAAGPLESSLGPAEIVRPCRP